MHIVITAATAGEIAPLVNTTGSRYASPADNDFTVQFHQGGVGMLATAFSISQLLQEQQPQLVIQAGIAGCFDASLPLGTVLAVHTEYLGDTGVEENGQWRDLFDLQLTRPDEAPFAAGGLPNPWLNQYNLLQLPTAASVTVNTITTRPERNAQLRQKYNPVIEGMEGAALHYACLRTNTPFIQIRSTSNYIGERDKTQWKMKDAILNLNNTLAQYLDALHTI